MLQFYILFAVLMLVLATLIYTYSRVTAASIFKEQVRDMLAQDTGPTHLTFQYAQLDGLPPPMQRYFNYVMKVGQPYINTVKLTHDGKFKTGEKSSWSDIRGTEYFVVDKPGYVWQGKTTLMIATDMYIADCGRLYVSILNMFKVIDAGGQHYNEGELQRWVSESVWFPTNLLPSDKISWEAIDNYAANLHFTYQDIAFTFLVSFNEIGEIESMQTMRYMGDEPERKSWLIKTNEYKILNGIRIPTRAEAIWNLEQPFSYARFRVKTIKYNLG